MVVAQMEGTCLADPFCERVHETKRVQHRQVDDVRGISIGLRTPEGPEEVQSEGLSQR